MGNLDLSFLPLLGVATPEFKGWGGGGVAATCGDKSCSVLLVFLLPAPKKTTGLRLLCLSVTFGTDWWF